MTRPALGRSRIQVTLPPALVAQLDAEAARLGTTRSALLEQAATELLRRRAHAFRITRDVDSGRITRD